MLSRSNPKDAAEMHSATDGLEGMEGVDVIAHTSAFKLVGRPILSRSNSKERLSIISRSNSKERPTLSRSNSKERVLSRSNSQERGVVLRSTSRERGRGSAAWAMSPMHSREHGQTADEATGRRAAECPTMTTDEDDVASSVRQRRLRPPGLALEICGRSSPAMSCSPIRSPFPARSSPRPAVKPSSRRSAVSSPLTRSPVQKRNAGAAEMREQCDKADRALALVRSMQSGLIERLGSMKSVMSLAQETVDACGKAIARWFGSLSGPALEAAISETFSKFDADGSGVIDKHEFSLAMHKLGLRLEADQLNALFVECDADGSGEIDLEEFMHMVLMHIKKPCKRQCQPCKIRGGCNQPHVYYEELSEHAASTLQAWCKAAIQRHSHRAPGAVSLSEGSRVSLTGLVHANEVKYNGSQGTVEQLLNDSRVEVKVDLDGQVLCIPSECAVPAEEHSQHGRQLAHGDSGVNFNRSSLQAR